jgi:MtN3 and saliva related transmembrane protein
MPTSEIVGFIAAALSAICFVPQAVRVIQTKDTNAISFWMYLLSLLSVICWLIYGLMLSSVPIILKNILVIILSGIILILKTRDLIKVKKDSAKAQNSSDQNNQGPSFLDS